MSRIIGCVRAIGVACLLLVAVAQPGEAELGCAVDVGGGVATCAENSDCGPVGSDFCSAGFCADCGDGPGGFFCACLGRTDTTAPAPAMSHLGLIAMVGMLGGLGFVGLRRRNRTARDISA